MAKPGRKATMTAAEKKDLKAQMTPLLGQLDAVRESKAQVQAAETELAEGIYEQIGGVQFRFKGDTLKISKRKVDGEDAYSITVLSAKKPLEF